MTDALPVGVVTAGDCIEVMATWPAASVDAIATDPPYGLEFMGREWDSFAPAAPTRRSGWDHAEPGQRIERDAAAAATPAGRTPVAYGKRRQTYVCDGCGKRDAFRNAHGCEVTTWTGEWVDALPLEALSYQEWCRRWAVEALRIAKPGAHLLAFGGTRTYHRLACAIEDAGWEVRDCLVWAYAQGFPKSHNVGKAIDRMAGAERDVPRSRTDDGEGFDPKSRLTGRRSATQRCETCGRSRGSQPGNCRCDTTGVPATPDAATWEGWGTALKPAWEPIILARKPLTGSVARNVLDHGTGALNIDGARIPMTPDDAELIAQGGGFLRAGYDAPEAVAYDGNMDGSLARKSDAEVSPKGRWPANLILTDPIFDGDAEQVVGGGYQSGGGNPAFVKGERSSDGITMGAGWRDLETGKVDTEGTYSRFFLIPKAARDDREPIVRGQLATAAPPSWSSGEQSPGTFQSRPTPPRENTHPTVKPVELMRHLVRLVTPPGGIVLDPFLGSGTTALAAELEGFPWLAIERDPESVAIAEARLHGTQRGMGLDVPPPAKARARSKGHWPKARPAADPERGFGFAGQGDLEERTAP